MIADLVPDNQLQNLRLPPRMGSLSPKNRAIYDALLAGYHGDYLQVLRHVRIERFESRIAIARAGSPVRAAALVSATERQVRAGAALGALPPSLQSVSLHEYGGEVVGATRGFIEFDNLLKRPLGALQVSTDQLLSVPRCR